MRLAFLCPEYPEVEHGGVGSFTRDLGRALVAAGHEVRVAGVYPTARVDGAYEEDAGVRVWRLPTPPGRFGWVYARYQQYRLVHGWIREGTVDLVESPDCYGWFAGWPSLPVPLVLRAHGSLRFYAEELGQSVPAMISRLEAWSHRRADAWAAVSGHAGEVTRKVFGLSAGPDAVLYNPVPIPTDAPPFEGREPHRVVYTGTLTAKKGVVSLIRAWPGVREQVPAAELHLYGKDQTVEGGRAMSAALQALLPERDRSSVHFHGHVRREELLAALETSRVAIFPSYTETFGLGPVEAMGRGAPTIYTRRSCGPEIVREGVDGLLVEPDDTAGIAGSIVSVLRDPALARRLAEAGRERALSLSGIEPVTARNVAFYEDVLREFRRGAQRAAA